MVTVAYRNIQNKIAEFLADQITLPELQDWIAPIAWDIDNDTDSDTARLVYTVELRMSEYDLGHLPREQFTEELAELAAGALNARPDSSTIQVGKPGEAIPSYEQLGSSLFGEVSATLSHC